VGGGARQWPLGAADCTPYRRRTHPPSCGLPRASPHPAPPHPHPQAKALLTELGASYEAIELDKMGKEGYELRAELAEVGRQGQEGRAGGQARGRRGRRPLHAGGLGIRCRRLPRLQTPAEPDPTPSCAPPCPAR
jgi:hypothetical protein